MSTDKDGTQAEVWEKVNGWTPAHPQWMVICKTPHERFPFKVIAKCEDDEPAADAIIEMREFWLANHGKIDGAATRQRPAP